MAVQMRSNFILSEKFERLRFEDFDVSLDSDSTPSTPSTPSSPPGDSYTLEIMDENDKDETLQFLRRFFIRDEPLNYSLGLLEGRSKCIELEDFCVKELDNGINLKAVSNGKMIGLCLNGILTKGYIDEIEEVDCPDKKFEKILKLLDHIAVESNIFGKFSDCDKALTVKILSVDTAWRGRGIAKELMDKSRDLARELGCRLMTVDCTSHFTAKAVKRLGFDCIYSLKYADFKINGEVALSPSEPHEAVTVYAQRIN